MAPVKIDPAKVREFKDAGSFYKWLAKHHDKDDEIWIKIHKVDSGLKSITPKEAIDSEIAAAKDTTTCRRQNRSVRTHSPLCAQHVLGMVKPYGRIKINHGLHCQIAR